MSSQPHLIVERVSHPRQWRDFFSLRRTIYHDDPAAVYPLKRMELIQLDTEKNPFYQHASREAFVCYRQGKPVGRIVAIKDDMHNEFVGDKVGFFGFFETVDDQAVVQRLINVAGEWLNQQGCDRIRGPVNPSMKGEFGVLVDGNQYPPTIMMGHTPHRYDRHLIDEGFDVAKTFYAFYFTKKGRLETDKWDDLADFETKVFARFPQLRFCAVDASNYAETFREINLLGNKVRSEGWGFVPLTDAELELMTKNLRQVIRFDMIHVAYWEDRLVGYIVNIPDVNWALRHTWGRWDWLRMLQLPFLIRKTNRTRVIALGVDPDFRQKGVAMLLIKRLTDAHYKYQELEFSWVLEDNLKSIRAIKRVVALDRYKTYRLYERALD